MKNMHIDSGNRAIMLIGIIMIVYAKLKWHAWPGHEFPFYIGGVLLLVALCLIAYDNRTRR